MSISDKGLNLGGELSPLLLAGGSVRTQYGSLTAIALGLLLVVWYINKRRLSSPSTGGKRLPPGPPAWPIIGNMHLIANGGLLHQALASLAEQYGPLMTLKLGSHTAVVATSAKMAKEILKTQNQFFCSRSETAAGDIMNYHRMNVVWAPYGEHLRAVRKICQTELLSNKRIISFEKIREEEVLSSIYTMLRQCKEGTVPLVLEESMSQLSTNNVSRMLFGKSFFGLKSSPSPTARKEFMELVRGIFHLTGVPVLGDFIPALKRFDIGGHEAKMKELAIKGDQFYTRILEERRSNSAGNTNKVPDFVDTLLALPAKDHLSDTAMKGLIATVRTMLRNSADLSFANLSFTMLKEMRASDRRRGQLEAMYATDMIFAGTDTSASQVCWTFAELLRNPEVLRKAVEELDTVVGRDKLMTEQDIPKLKYLQCIIKESFRLHPVAVCLPYESTEATTIDGYYIPAKTRIFVNNHAISRSEENWENALEFIPERFFETTRDVRGQDFEMMPFGAGRRMCIGMNLGLLMVQLTVGQMLHVCNWSLTPGMKPEDVDVSEEAGISVPMKVPLNLIATHRLAPSILNDFIASLG